MRVLRPDKLTLAALEATLAHYRDGELLRVPVLRALGASADALRPIADRLAAAIGAVETSRSPSSRAAPPSAAARCRRPSSRRGP